MIGSIKETQEMLDFCGKHDITADIEIIDIQAIMKRLTGSSRVMSVTALSSTWRP